MFVPVSVLSLGRRVHSPSLQELEKAGKGLFRPYYSCHPDCWMEWGALVVVWVSWSRAGSPTLSSAADMGYSGTRTVSVSGSCLLQGSRLLCAGV